jgi:CBS domain-containing protein
MIWSADAMDRSSPVRDLMNTDALTFAPTDNVETAMRALLEKGVSAAPVVGPDGTVVGVLSDADLIVQESQLHFPTVLSILGASIELGHKRFDEDLQKALGATVAEVMSDDPVTVSEDDTVEDAATLMHDEDLASLPVLRDGKLAGVITRRDVLRAILAGG